MNSPPLQGQRMLITRAAEQTGELAERLRALGAEPWEVPTIAVGPPEDWGPLDGAIARLGEFDWLVLTSVNGVRYFRARLGERALPGSLRLAAVGPRTAEAMREAGWHVAVMPEAYTGEALAETMAPEAAGRRFLLVRGDLAGSDLPGGLRRAGGHVTDVVAYINRPRPVPAEVGEALAGGAIDWALFASGSAFRALVAALPDATVLKRVKLGSIGVKTSAVIRELGFEVAAEGDPMTLEGMVDAVVRRQSDG